MTLKKIARCVLSEVNLQEAEKKMVIGTAVMFFEINTDIAYLIEIQKRNDFNGHEYSYEIGVRSQLFLDKILPEDSDWFILCPKDNYCLQQCVWRKHEQFLASSSAVWRHVDHNDKDMEKLAKSLAMSINTYAIPELHKISSLFDIARIWREGNAPGLTHMQRSRYLSMI